MAFFKGSAWLSCIPKTKLLTADAYSFCSMIRLRLGADLPGVRSMQCRCKWRGVRGHIDTKGYHLMSQCLKGNQRFTTHHGLTHTYTQMFHQAGFVTRLEVPHTYTLVDNFMIRSEKRADLIVKNFTNGRACFDVSVTILGTQRLSDPLQETQLPGRQQNSGKPGKGTCMETSLQLLG